MTHEERGRRLIFSVTWNCNHATIRQVEIPFWHHWSKIYVFGKQMPSEVDMETMSESILVRKLAAKENFCSQRNEKAYPLWRRRWIWTKNTIRITRRVRLFNQLHGRLRLIPSPEKCTTTMKCQRRRNGRRYGIQNQHRLMCLLSICRNLTPSPMFCRIHLVSPCNWKL